MDIYKTDEEKGEALKLWIRENGVSVLAGVFIGLAVIFGGRSWVEYGQQKTEQASYLYFQMMDAASQNADDSVLLLAGQLLEKFGDTPYASAGAMMRAKINQAQGDVENAVSDLEWVVEHAQISAQIHGARIHLIRTLLADKQVDAAQQVLSAIKDKVGFVAIYEDLQGDVYRVQARLQEAKASYQRALDALSAGAAMRSMIEVKRNSIVGKRVGVNGTEATGS
ncbi:MAG: tetratricopeptide repeat protein [Gammaproteobacteria bacterium]|nr:tetratricopeptide repeat protein [Gammaproteobacteria bacterium]